MFIRHLIGPRKGEIEDIIFDRAKVKVLSGEAEDVYHQLGLQPKPVNVAAEPTAQATIQALASEPVRVVRKKRQ